MAPFAAIDFIDRSHGWEVTLDEAGNKVEVARTADGGTTWSAPVAAATFYLGDTGMPRFGVRFANLDYGWLFGQGLFASTDGGFSWTATPVQAFVYDVAIAGSSVWALTDRGMFRSEAGSMRWTAMAGVPTTGPGPLQLIRTNENLAFIAEQAQFETRLFRTTDAGASWHDVAVPCKGYAMPVATMDGVHVWMVCGSQPGAGEQAKWTYTSDDGGGHWTLRSFADGTKTIGTVPLIGYAHWLGVTSATAGFMANDRGDIYRSTDRGRTWTASGLANASEGFYSGLQFVDASTGWLAGLVEGVTPDGAVGLFRTTDGGATWTLIASRPGTTA